MTVLYCTAKEQHSTALSERMMAGARSGYPCHQVKLRMSSWVRGRQGMG